MRRKLEVVARVRLIEALIGQRKARNDRIGDDVGGCRRAARDLDVNGHDFVHGADDTVSLGEHAAIQYAVTARDHHPGLWGRRHRIAQRFGHVARHHAGNQQRIGMPG